MKILQTVWTWLDERAGIKAIVEHPVPRERGWRGWMYIFGSATLVSFLVAVISGIPIAATYIPSTGSAYQSIQWLDTVAALGKQLRGIHDLSATAMLLLVGLHVIRVFLTGSFKYPRELNWLTGVVLLFLTVGMLFTGQILRWDGFGLWTLSILSFIASRVPFIGGQIAHFLFGGPTLEGDTLSRMFTFHVFILPGLLFSLIGFHLYLVLKLGISESPRRGKPVDPRHYRQWYEALLKREGVPFWPDAAWRDVVFGVCVVIAIVVLAVLIGPTPLSGPPDPQMVLVQPRPDWYFTWLFAGFALIPAEAENVAMIGAPLAVIAVLLFVPFVANSGERAPTRRPWAVVTVATVLLMIISLTVTGLVAPWSPRFQATTIPPPVSRGLTGAPAQGALLFASAGCQYCHSVMAGTGGIAGPSLENIGEQLTTNQLTIRILNGATNMPAFATILSPIQVHDLVAFLLTRSRWKTGATGH